MSSKSVCTAALRCLADPQLNHHQLALLPSVQHEPGEGHEQEDGSLLQGADPAHQEGAEQRAAGLALPHLPSFDVSDLDDPRQKAALMAVLLKLASAVCPSAKERAAVKARLALLQLGPLKDLVSQQYLVLVSMQEEGDEEAQVAGLARQVLTSLLL
jgi:hypothetical protein